jgi:hypothetical protein
MNKVELTDCFNPFFDDHKKMVRTNGHPLRVTSSPLGDDDDSYMALCLVGGKEVRDVTFRSGWCLKRHQPGAGPIAVHAAMIGMYIRSVLFPKSAFGFQYVFDQDFLNLTEISGEITEEIFLERQKSYVDMTRYVIILLDGMTGLLTSYAVRRQDEDLVLFKGLDIGPFDRFVEAINAGHLQIRDGLFGVWRSNLEESPTCVSGCEHRRWIAEVTEKGENKLFRMPREITILRFPERIGEKQENTQAHLKLNILGNDCSYAVVPSSDTK